MKKYPIAERFTSLQGEGLYTGTLMYFIRFAGCSVGKKTVAGEVEKLRVDEKDPLPIYREKCTLYDGREFLCDTDFRTKEVLTTAQLFADIPEGVEHICLTGGEPLNQPLAEFMLLVTDTDYQVHIETSGTVSIKKSWPEFSDGYLVGNPGGWLWLTVSPKFGVLPEMLEMANEIKLLVDKDFDITKLPEGVMRSLEIVWVQPVNEEWEVYGPNVERCIKLIHEHPTWRMSSQAHKIWRVR